MYHTLVGEVRSPNPHAPTASATQKLNDDEKNSGWGKTRVQSRVVYWRS